MKRRALRSVLQIGLVLLAVVVVCPDAQALPSFTRQTGLQCNVCHSHPPELTAFGRKFKLEGYTLTAADTTIEGTNLKISRYLPISVMVLLSYSATNEPVPGAQNGNVEFPQTLNLSLGGAISPHAGGLVEISYSAQENHVGLEMADIRYARHTTLGSKDLLVGLTVNNDPTLADVWNSTPSWGYPWLSPDNTPAPIAEPLIAGGLSQDVAGLGGYTMWNSHLYAGLTLYRSAHLGGPQPLTGTDFTYNIQGAAPYWRLAWQQTWGLNYLEVGTYGIHVSSVPGGVTGTPDTYTDAAADLQFERPFGVNLLTAHATYIHEASTLDGTFAAGGAAAPAQHLNTWRADATYHLGNRYTLRAAGASTTGSADPVLFAPAPVTGSALGSPNSTKFIGQVGFWPQQNVALSIAYTGYTTFNGGSRNYDGAGRNASANNSVYVSLWLNF